MPLLPDYTEPPTGAQVLAYLGWPSDPALIEQADEHAEQAVQIIKSYTRGRDFDVSGEECEESIAGVIITYAARSLSNPSSAREVEAGSFRESPGSPWSFSLIELLILQGHRRMAG